MSNLRNYCWAKASVIMAVYKMILLAQAPKVKLFSYVHLYTKGKIQSKRENTGSLVNLYIEITKLFNVKGKNLQSGTDSSWMIFFYTSAYHKKPVTMLNNDTCFNHLLKFTVPILQWYEFPNMEKNCMLLIELIKCSI